MSVSGLAAEPDEALFGLIVELRASVCEAVQDAARKGAMRGACCAFAEDLIELPRVDSHPRRALPAYVVAISPAELDPPGALIRGWQYCVTPRNLPRELRVEEFGFSLADATSFANPLARPGLDRKDRRISEPGRGDRVSHRLADSVGADVPVRDRWPGAGLDLRKESGKGCLAEVRDECDGSGHLRDVVKLSR
jgi:hypothetical protein